MSNERGGSGTVRRSAEHARGQALGWAATAALADPAVVVDQADGEMSLPVTRSRPRSSSSSAVVQPACSSASV